MQRTLAVILGGGRGTRLFPLTMMRAKPAVPLGGKYRLIDVPISNCLNSGLNQIYILTQFESTSLHRHVKGTYRFDRFGAGFVEILAAQQRYQSDHWYQGTADAVRQNLQHFGDHYDEVLILSGDQLYRMDFQRMLARHRETGADMTVAVLPVPADTAGSLGIATVDQTGQVTGFCEKPTRDRLAGLETPTPLFESFHIEAKNRRYLASMGIYLFDREVLYSELREQEHVDFGKDFFPAAVKQKRVAAFLFDGYWEDIGTVRSFHEANLSLARIDAPFSFSTEHGLIYTRPRTLPSTVVGNIRCTDAIIADGCRVEEAELVESILGIRSITGRNFRLKRTLVMGADFYEHEAERRENRKLGRPDIGFGDHVEIENAIVDKNARIGSNVVIKNPHRIQPADTDTYVVRDGIICIVKGAIIPDGTRIGV